MLAPATPSDCFTTVLEAFRKAHANAGQSKREGLYLGPPSFEGFEVIQTVSDTDNA